jgi:alpha-L-rhamnosidase
MFGTVDTWFYKALAGIRLEEPGFKSFTVKPFVPEDLTHAQASTKTVNGIISSEWSKSYNSFKLNVVVPVNTKAKVYIPKLKFNKVLIKESEKIIWRESKFIETEGILSESEEENYVVFEVGSGSYHFEVTEMKELN